MSTNTRDTARRQWSCTATPQRGAVLRKQSWRESSPFLSECVYSFDEVLHKSGRSKVGSLESPECEKLGRSGTTLMTWHYIAIANFSKIRSQGLLESQSSKIPNQNSAHLLFWQTPQLQPLGSSLRLLYKWQSCLWSTYIQGTAYMLLKWLHLISKTG